MRTLDDTCFLGFSGLWIFDVHFAQFVFIRRDIIVSVSMLFYDIVNYLFSVFLVYLVN